jgi:hypothetical protein
MSTNKDYTIAITAADRASMERQLDEAVTHAKAQALQGGQQGILVTRINLNSFTVTLSDTVPFGLTRERQDW